MNRYIFESLKSLREQKAFSMPGHKSKKIYDFGLSDDITEVEGSDNLLDPSGCILKSEEEIAKIYGVENSFFITEGSTMALKIAIFLLSNPGDRVLIQRNSHKSIYNSAVEFGLDLEYLHPKFDEKKQLLLGVSAEDLKRALDENPNIKLVVLTSPNYYGAILKLKELSEIVHSHGAKLIVDEAHGSHLVFSNLKEFSAVHYADITVHSTHKTIPSLTGSSLLHTNGIDRREVLKVMNLLMSSSPSYLLMLSSEFGVDYMQRNSHKFYDLKKLIEDFKTLKSVEFLELEDETIAAMDILKLAFRVRGMSGLCVVKELSLRYNIRIEMGDLYYALCILSVVDEESDFNALKSALREMSKGEFLPIEKTKKILPKKILTPEQAFRSKSETVNLKDAIGRVSSKIIMLYPPGVPIISYGEEFTEEIVEELLLYPQLSGMDENRVEVVDERFIYKL